jgi:hypothetical protein
MTDEEIMNEVFCPERKPMTLLEAIKHCNEQATAQINSGRYGCAFDHEQLSKWLKILYKLIQMETMELRNSNMDGSKCDKLPIALLKGMRVLDENNKITTEYK